jgi:2-amino-4-hydroxy-6-hydroxymethyldihydropteridine diphosphokinase
MSIVTYIGLGSNLGDSKVILTEAVHKLASLGRCEDLQAVSKPTDGTTRPA